MIILRTLFSVCFYHLMFSLLYSFLNPEHKIYTIIVASFFLFCWRERTCDGIGGWRIWKNLRNCRRSFLMRLPCEIRILSLITTITSSVLGENFINTFRCLSWILDSLFFFFENNTHWLFLLIKRLISCVSLTIFAVHLQIGKAWWSFSIQYLFHRSWREWREGGCISSQASCKSSISAAIMSDFFFVCILIRRRDRKDLIIWRY